MSTQLTESEYQLLQYLRDPLNSRDLSDMAKAVGIHYTHASRCLRWLKQKALVNVRYGRFARLNVEVID